MILGRLDLRVAFDGRVAWWRFAWVNGDRSPYARRFHRATEDLPHWPARGRRLLLGPLNLVLLWRCSRRRLAARRARLADWRP